MKSPTGDGGKTLGFLIRPPEKACTEAGQTMHLAGCFLVFCGVNDD
jgi:hypothetical protein